MNKKLKKLSNENDNNYAVYAASKSIAKMDAVKKLLIETVTDVSDQADINTLYDVLSKCTTSDVISATSIFNILMTNTGYTDTLKNAIKSDDAFKDITVFLVAN